jgi:hypothetical protein
MGLVIFLLIYNDNISTAEESEDGFWRLCMRLNILASMIVKIQVD